MSSLIVFLLVLAILQAGVHKVLLHGLGWLFNFMISVSAGVMAILGRKVFWGLFTIVAVLGVAIFPVLIAVVGIAFLLLCGKRGEEYYVRGDATKDFSASSLRTLG